MRSQSKTSQHVLVTCVLLPLLTSFYTYRWDSELISVTGLILHRSYRIDQDALATSGLAAAVSLQGPSSSSGVAAASQILALNVQSLQYPDTTMVYYHQKHCMSSLLGVIPGAIVTFHAFKMKSSRSGNIYCTSCASSSIEINSFEGAGFNVVGRQKPDRVSPEMSNLTPTSLNNLMQALLHGKLSRRVVCIRAAIAAVQHVNLQFICKGCQCAVVDGNCMATCLQKNPVLKAEAR